MIEYQNEILTRTRSAIKAMKQPSGVVEFELNQKNYSVYVEAEFAISLTTVDVYYTTVIYTEGDLETQTLTTQERHYLSKLFYNHIN